MRENSSACFTATIASLVFVNIPEGVNADEKVKKVWTVKLFYWLPLYIALHSALLILEKVGLGYVGGRKLWSPGSE